MQTLIVFSFGDSHCGKCQDILFGLSLGKTGLQIRVRNKNTYFSTKTYIVGTQKNRPKHMFNNIFSLKMLNFTVCEKRVA